MSGPPSDSPIWNISGANWITYTPNPRFAIYTPSPSAGSGDAVWDKETGLVWERSPSTQKQSWDASIVTSFAKVVATRMGWRLPAMEELLSLSDPSQSGLRLPAGNPFQNIQNDYFYWSSSLGMTSPPTFAWGYDFGNGSSSNVLKTASAYVWLVRGGYGHDYPY
jgi:uncharacterized protein DUF1566